MKNPIKTYQFWIKIFAAALTIVLGLWILLDNTIAKVIVLMFTGLVTGIYALIRVIPLIKTLKTHRGRLISIFEIVIDLLLSVYLCYSAINLRENPTSDLAEFNDIYYRFFIAFILYLRTVVYFMCTVLFKEETDKSKFWIHILLITLACVLCSLNDITTEGIAITLAVISFLVSIVLVGEGGSGYFRYRKMIYDQRNKKEEVNNDVNKECPTDNNIIIPIDDMPQDSSIVS